MDDIRRHDVRLFSRELLSPTRLIILMIVLAILGTNFLNNFQVLVTVLPVTLMAIGASAWSESIRKRFSDRRFAALWAGCQDRLTRFEEVLAKMRKDQIGDLSEMPKTIRSVADALYVALRRADIVSTEVAESEKGLYNQPPVWQAAAQDPQSKELYRVADKNIAEYRSHYQGVVAGVQRAEAQAAVFMTTLDTLRMKMLGYRLVGRSPELPSHDFLEALAEAKAQLQAIDTALEELDLGHYPKTISVVPPPIPKEVADSEHLQQGS